MSNQQPVQLTPEGSVRCCYCRTDEHGLPPGDMPISPTHWGTRFRNNPNVPLDMRMSHQKGEWSQWRWRITLDGEDVTGNCFELEAGDNGWVAVYYRDGDGKKQMCKAAAIHADHEHALAYIERGRVVAEKITL